MGRPKGSKNGVVAGQNPSDNEDVEQGAEIKETASEKKSVEIATCNTWRYHEHQLPQLFKEGEEIPEGWNNANGNLWFRKTDGTWIRHKK